MGSDQQRLGSVSLQGKEFREGEVGLVIPLRTAAPWVRMDFFSSFLLCFGRCLGLGASCTLKLVNLRVVLSAGSLPQTEPFSLLPRKAEERQRGSGEVPGRWEALCVFAVPPV